METTFISIHNLDDDATILYTSDSVIDILGYTPDDVVNRSAWHFFPKHELPRAQQFHKKRVTKDNAAVLVYCTIRHKDGEWIGCECCFSIVYDVMIVCTSVYKRGLDSDKRALEAPLVRRIFTSSPADPRYHMLSHLSHKFRPPPKQQHHEPRAALFLNRFTRTLSIMYATAGIEEIVGISADAMRGRSFYYCIAENCLDDAIKCLEQAKGNNSIAYLRFWFRDPRQDDHPPPPDDDSDEEMTTDASINDSASSLAVDSGDSMDVDDHHHHPAQDSRNSSHDSTHPSETHEAIFGEDRPAHSSASSTPSSPPARSPDPVELEAVISCASDGLVVCLRKARPILPPPTHRPSRPVYENGMFAAPWAAEPVLPPIDVRAGAGFAPAFAPALGPQGAQHHHTPAAAATATARQDAGQSDFMTAIREQAVFAWALTGINGSLADFSHGKPMGESLPANGLPVWKNDVGYSSGSENGYHSGRETSGRSPQDAKQLGTQIFGDPGLGRAGASPRGVNGGGSAGHTPNGGAPR